jgi:CDP-2,3-bis-(O-geranylgeranyl)-sn-glycerol synthase
MVLIAAANSAPIFAKRLLGERLAWALDGGLRLADGQPLLGRSKTVRGVLVGIFLPAALAPLFGYPWWQGLAIGGAAIGGDLISSFIKRRLKLAPSSQAIGLDQIPESLLPALVARTWFDLSLPDIALVVGAFLVSALVLSKLLFRVGLRERPY